MMKNISISFAAALVLGIAWVSSSVANADLVIKNASDEIVSGGGSIDLGETVAIDPRLTQIQISNTDVVAVENLTGVFQGSAAADYSLLNLSATTIPPMSSVTATIRFTPKALGQRDASLVISSNSPAAVQASVSLRGTGGTVFAPIISATETFPVVTQSWSAKYTFGTITLRNHPTAEPIVIARVRGTSSGFTAPAEGIVYGNYNGTLYSFRYKVSAMAPAPSYLVTHTLSWFVGSADASFDSARNARGGTLAIQPDGKIILAGNSISIGGQTKARMVRLNPDGSLDSSFQAIVGGVTSICIDDDGKIFLAGAFGEVNGQPRVGMAKLNANGSLDESFVPMLADSPQRAIVLPDGKVMLCSVLNTVGPIQRQQLVRLLADGSVDPAFDVGSLPEGAVSMPYIWGMGVQPDGKVLAGPVNINGGLVNLARFNTDGSVDCSFQCDMGSFISAVVVQPDGKILVGGHFDKVNGISKRCIVRLNSDGSVDTGFSAPAPYGLSQLAVSAIAIQADGRIVISGVFEGIGDQERGIPMARLYPDGTLDKSFDPGGSGERIESLAIDRTGAVFVTGVFTKIGGITRSGFAKLTNDPATSALDFVDSDSLRWTQAGTTPMLTSAEFEVSTDSGGTWSSLGQGTRIPEGWQIDGVSLPSNGFVRARGRQFVSNRGFGEIGEVKLFGRALSPLEAWRQEKFGTPLNHSDAANTFDADADGVPNLAEYGFGLDPRNPSSNQIPAWSPAGDDYVVSFQKPAGTETLIHGAEWSQTMNPGDWHPAEDLSSGNEKSFRVSRDSRAALFFRLKVTEP